MIFNINSTRGHTGSLLVDIKGDVCADVPPGLSRSNAVDFRA